MNEFNIYSLLAENININISLPQTKIKKIKGKRLINMLRQRVSIGDRHSYVLFFFFLQERNSRIFKGIHKSPSRVIDQVKFEVHVKVTRFRSVIAFDLNLLLCRN